MAAAFWNDVVEQFDIVPRMSMSARTKLPSCKPFDPLSSTLSSMTSVVLGNTFKVPCVGGTTKPFKKMPKFLKVEPWSELPTSCWSNAIFFASSIFPLILASYCFKFAARKNVIGFLSLWLDFVHKSKTVNRMPSDNKINNQVMRKKLWHLLCETGAALEKVIAKPKAMKELLTISMFSCPKRKDDDVEKKLK